MTDEELLDKVIAYSQASFKENHSNRKLNNRYNCAYMVTMLFMDFPYKPISDVLLEVLDNLLMYKKTEDPNKNYYGISVEDIDDYLYVIMAISRYIRSIKYYEKEDNTDE